MDIKEIKELIESLKDTDYTYIEIKHNNSQIILSKEKVNSDTPKEEIKEIKEIKTELTERKANIEEDNCHIIKSPIVGVFYSAPSPGEENYVKIGDKIKKGDTLCIIEAMKLMNEIDSDVDGEIVEILLSNEDIVEYNQPLFKIKTR